MAETVRAAIVRAAAALTQVSETARLDAELLAAHALGVSRDALLLGRLDNPAPAGFEALVARRLTHEPVAYIVGRRDFWTISLRVGPGVLVPRADTETLIEAAVEHFAGTDGPRTVLDLGTGSGALLLAALDQWPQAQGVGIDALAGGGRGGAGHCRGARAGGPGGGPARRLGGRRAGARPAALQSALYRRGRAPAARRWRRMNRLPPSSAGADGLDDYRLLAPLVRGQIAPGGVACIEIGSTQGETAAALFQAQGLAVAGEA